MKDIKEPDNQQEIPKQKAKTKRKTKSMSNNSILNLLLEFPFIKILPSYVIQEISHSITEQKCLKHEIVLKQGDPITNLYIVKSGSFIFTINHESIAQVSQDIHSFIQYQAITEEPFLEKRRYELTGKIKNYEQIPIFIYQRKKFFGDIEIIIGRNNSLFNIIANEENSSLYVIDRIKWVRLTRRIRIIFTKITLKKIEMIYERIINVLKGKNYLNIDKMKLYKEKIHEQIEVNNNFDIYSKILEKNEKRLKNDVDKYNLNKINEKYRKDKLKSLRNFYYNKDYLLNLFKFPNILKDDVKTDLNKYLFIIKDKDTQKFKLRNTISKFNLEQDASKFNIISNKRNQNAKSNLFMTNLIKPVKNYSANNIYDSIKTQKILRTKRIKNMTLGQEINTQKSSLNINSSSLINFYKSSKIIYKSNDQKRSSKSLQDTINNYNENVLSKKMNNLILQTILNKGNNTNKKNILKSIALKGRNKLKLANKKTASLHSDYKRERMNKDLIDNILKEKYQSSKDKLIEKLFGNKSDEVSFNIKKYNNILD